MSVHVPTGPSAALLASVERNRKRVWGLCYRMTGARSDADELAQETFARAFEREGDLTHRDRLDGWLLRIATTVCLDHLRRRTTERRVTDLVDPLDIPERPFDADQARGPEAAVILRDDLRFAVVVALQRLPPRQRAALILHDVFDRSLAEVAEVLDTNPNAANALVSRARLTLAEKRVHIDVDTTADRAVVDRVVQAIASGRLEDFYALLADDVWQVTDGGGVARAASKPIFGLRAVTRFWAAVVRQETTPVACRVRMLNGEPAIVLTTPDEPGAFATIHLETRGGRIAGVHIVRDPRRLAQLTGH